MIDSGTANRVLGTLLSWLANKSTSVFIVATANNIAHRPTEMRRKGRFDEIFFIDLHDIIERNIIWGIHLKTLLTKTWHKYNNQCLARYSDLFSSAEIKQVMIDAIQTLFSQHQEFNSTYILDAVEKMVLLAFSDQANISQIQE
jgi:SpoVK/Ycf46/Vps4 family AAA+-type ATPase